MVRRNKAQLSADTYGINRATGSFILVDEATNNAVAAEMMVEVAS
ncbi:MAG TPA: hypothetical protein VEG37_10820 [Burkholderiales bacterium]|nr:hypothetical protein [Burkholderiales bacterium]